MFSDKFSNNSSFRVVCSKKLNSRKHILKNIHYLTLEEIEDNIQQGLACYEYLAKFIKNRRAYFHISRISNLSNPVEFFKNMVYKFARFCEIECDVKFTLTHNPCSNSYYVYTNLYTEDVEQMKNLVVKFANLHKSYNISCSIYNQSQLLRLPYSSLPNSTSDSNTNTSTFLLCSTPFMIQDTFNCHLITKH